MSNVPRIVAVALALLCPLPAWAHGGPLRSRSMSVAYYPALSVVAYQPYPILVASPLLVCPPPPAAVPVVPNYARPTPAPPSAAPPAIAPQTAPTTPGTTPGLPLPPPSAPMNPVPRVSEGRSFYYDAYPLKARDTDRPARERCTVAIWNVTGRTVTLKLDGQSQVLASGQCLTRDLARDFVWQIDGHDPEKRTIPAGDAGLEIVIRQ